MAKRIAATILTLFIVFTFSMTVLSAEEKITIVFDNSYPPYMYQAESYTMGLYPKLTQAVFTRMGLEVEVLPLPWKRALLKGEKGTAAIGGIYKNDKRLEIYDYSESIFEEKLVIFVKKGNAFDFKGLSDLKGKRVGLNLGWSYGQEFDEARERGLFKVQEAKSNWTNLQKLIKDRVDCVVVDRLSASQIIHLENIGDEVEELKVPVAINTAHIVFAKSTHKNDLLNRFNITLSEMKEDGSYSKIIEVFLMKEKDLSIVTTEYVPYAGRNLKDYGATSKLVIEAFKQSGYKTSIHFVPWSRATLKAEKGIYHAVFPAFYTDERAEKFYYSDVIAKGVIVFLKRKEDPITYKTLKDLKPYKIGVIRAYANTPKFDAADYLKKLIVNSDLIGIKKLLAKHVDLIITDKSVAQYIIDNSFKDEAATLEFMWPPLEEKPFYLMVSKRTNGAAKIVEQFNQGLKLISGNGK